MARESFWTDKRTKRLHAILRKSTTVDDAIETARAEFKRKFSPTYAYAAIRRMYGVSPASLLAQQDYEPVRRVEEIRNAAELKSAKAQLRQLERAHDELHAAHEALAEVKERAHEYAVKPPPRAKAGKREAAPVILCSDWHVGSRVRSEVINGLNSFDLDIARKRIGKLWQGVAWELQHHSRGYDFPCAFLWLGGDLIDGWLHDEQMHASCCPPIEQVLVCAAEIEAGIKTILAALPKSARLIVPCSVGNHGRTTHRKHFSQPAETNLEWGMYHSLASRFADNERVEFQIFAGSVGYTRIWDHTIRWTHGDDVRYAGGILGLGVPYSKAIRSWDAGHRASVTVTGHWHQFQTSMSPGYVINGSIKGYDGYALAKKLDYQAPCQAFFLLDKTRGRKETSAIWVD